MHCSLIHSRSGFSSLSSWFALFLAAGSLAFAGCSDGDGSSSSESTQSTTGSTSGTGTGGAGGEGGSGATGGAGGEGGGAGGGGGGAAMVEVQIHFEGRVGDKVFACDGTYAGLGTSAFESKLTDFRLYIHDVRLHKAGGEEISAELVQDGLWQYKTLALLDFEDKSGSCANGTEPTNGVVRAMVPEGAYDGISFKLGVPFDLNHGDASVAPSPLNLSGLFWSWNGGYKFLRVDSVPAAGGEPFNLHLGSTGCVGDNGDVTSCERSNVAEINLPGFDPAKSTIVVDYAAAVSGSDLAVNQGGAPGCMSGPTDPECAPIFERLGINIADGSLDPKKQTLFTLK